MNLSKEIATSNNFYINLNFLTVVFGKYYYDNIREFELGRACSMRGKVH